FHRIFREIAAVTPARFLAAMRMAEAARLLLHSAAPVTDISARVGYASVGTFTTQFGRLLRVSPARFRILVRSVCGQRVGQGPGPGSTACGAGGMQPGRELGGPTVVLSGESGPGSLVVGRLFPVRVLHDGPVPWTLTTGTDGARLSAAPEAGDYAMVS